MPGGPTRNRWSSSLIPALTARGARRVLDVGTGIGRHALAFARAGFEVVAVDASADRARGNCVVAADAEGLRSRRTSPRSPRFPIDDGSVDHVLAWNVLYHGDGDIVRNAVRRVQPRVLRADGTAQLTMLSKRNRCVRRRARDPPRHVRRRRQHRGQGPPALLRGRRDPDRDARRGRSRGAVAGGHRPGPTVERLPLDGARRGSHAVPDRLLFVTQVAPYRDGPAGVHGVLDQAAVGVAQVAELHGLQPQRVDDVRTLDAAALRDAARARAVHDRRDAVERGAARRDPRPRARRVAGGARRSIRRPTRATGGTSTARSSAPASTGTRGRRRSPPTCSTRRIPRARTSAPSGSGTTRCTSSAICDPTRGCCCASATASSTSTAPGARPPSFGYPLAWCFARGRRPRVLDQPRPLPARVGDARVPAAPRGRPRLGAGATTREHATPARRARAVLPGPYPPHDPLDAVVVHARAGRARRASSRATTTAHWCNPGTLGLDLTVEQGAEAARWCALNALSVLHAELGDLDRDRAGAHGARLRRVRAGLRRNRRRSSTARAGCSPTSSATPVGTAAPPSVSPRSRGGAVEIEVEVALADAD